MSSTIRDFSQIREQEISGLKKQVARERRALEEIHQKTKAEIKASQEKEIVELRDDHTQNINQAHERREKVLAELEKNLNNTKDLTEKQLAQIKQDASIQEKKIADDHEGKRQLLNANQESYLEQSNYRFNSQIEKLNTQGENRISETKENLSLKHNEIDSQYQNKIQQTVNRHETELGVKENEFKRVSAQREKEYKNKEINLRQDHENRIIEQTEVNQNLYQSRDDDFRNKFYDQDKFFEKKFENQLTSHHSQLGNLDNKFEQLSRDLKLDLMNKIEAVEKKENDIFFEFSELNHSLKAFADHYILDVELPEYAKNQLSLTTNNKELILTLNRRYQDQVDKEGVKHKVNKVETLSSRITTESFLNPKKITSSYADGVMSYKIAKA